MKTQLIILALIVTGVAHAKPAVKVCQKGEQIQVALNEDWNKLQPLIQTIPLPTDLQYKDLVAQPVLGYADFSKPGKASVHITGHYCRGYMGRDELSVLLCHELGHAMGGNPTIDFLNEEQSLPVSAEGQADFFATSSCLPLLWRNDDNTSYLAKALEQPELNRLCPAAGKTNEERGLCMRIAFAAYNFALYVRQGTVDENEGIIPPRDAGPVPRLDKKDEKVVKQTLTNQHPLAQCRLDTFLAGLACQATQLPANFSLNPLTPLSCGFTAESVARPACWYQSATN